MLNVLRTHLQRIYSLSADHSAADGVGQGKAMQGKERQKETYLAGIMLCLDKLFKRNDINDKVISLLNGIPFLMYRRIRARVASSANRLRRLAIIPLGEIVNVYIIFRIDNWCINGFD